ncbi:glycosyltransferase family 1 protein [Coleofasciculus sp. FACHB-1120]|uniref:glycosyltransferase family 4 protein n=1 Tax=Coleofasciculus sp. FACHB-1120 TaxID=2692783 RepID=UPI001684FFD1|nr:glycosyltransferase family 1 protein [Coleofasciculus sp. FACHB-1120]MBD2743552.1 glycosyltransferase family 4 protein [Coleofasciculus sp. FACHB-1120]
MRIFIDCTHTANHTYKNTGIHRVVRQLTLELTKLSLTNANIKAIPVKFDGNFISKVTSLYPENETQASKSNLVSNPVITKIINKFNLFVYKANNKIRKASFFKYLFYKPSITTLKESDAFEGVKLSPEDVYLIVDSNWDLPNSYYNFLKRLKNHGVTIVLVCYDLIPLKFPEFCSKDFCKAFSEFFIQYSSLVDRVIGISRQSAKDYLEAKEKGILPNTNPNQVVTSFRLGCDSIKSQEFQVTDDNGSEDTEFKSVLNEQYILVVGSLVPHKNIKTIVAAFDLLGDSNENVHLVFAGNRGWDLETDRLIELNKKYGRFMHIFGSITDSQLQLLYENCYCLVQASFYEGFGLPVVEALQHYKPVIASTGGSLPEVGGDFCIYFDPNQPQELYKALTHLLSSDAYYNQLVNRLKTEYKPFSWQESAQELLSNLYK